MPILIDRGLSVIVEGGRRGYPRRRPSGMAVGSQVFGAGSGGWRSRPGADGAEVLARRGGQVFTPPCDWERDWREAMSRMVRLAMRTMAFSR